MIVKANDDEGAQSCNVCTRLNDNVYSKTHEKKYASVMTEIVSNVSEIVLGAVASALLIELRMTKK